MNSPILPRKPLRAVLEHPTWYHFDTMAMTLRLNTEQDRALSLLVQAQGCSKQEAAVRAIVSAAARSLADDHISQLATTLIPGHAALEARIRRSRSS